MPAKPIEGILNADGSTTYRITKLRKLLLDQDLRNYQIAALAGIHPYTLSLYVQGKRDPSIDHLRSLCTVLNVTEHDLLGWYEVTLNEEAS